MMARKNPKPVLKEARMWGHYEPIGELCCIGYSKADVSRWRTPGGGDQFVRVVVTPLKAKRKP